ncbi:UDP-N-acetylglucosamine 2-epimerase (hydrolyzing) (EC 3.2.1.183) [Azospirillum doebereinerae]
MDQILGNTIGGFSRFVRDVKPDLIVIHGDRLEALAGASVGALAGIPVAHIEGGEVSGTVDESIRHAVSKLSHLHLVANGDAALRLRQLGEEKERIHIIGSPEIDVMLSADLPSLDDVKRRYQIPFDRYAIGIFHSVTTELDSLAEQVGCYTHALIESNENYVMIFPNNDIGSSIILDQINSLKSSSKFKLYPSLRFEYFLALLKNARFIIGNSSVGVREAPVYGVPSIDIGSRQRHRGNASSILRCKPETHAIGLAIAEIGRMGQCQPSLSNGSGHSCDGFLDLLRREVPWRVSLQKHFQPYRPDDGQ